MFVVDTNVLIYAADKDSPGHTRCRELLELFRAQTTPFRPLRRFGRTDRPHPRLLARNQAGAEAVFHSAHRDMRGHGRHTVRLGEA